MTIPHYLGKRRYPAGGGDNHPEGCQALFAAYAANKPGDGVGCGADAGDGVDVSCGVGVDDGAATL